MKIRKDNIFALLSPLQFLYNANQLMNTWLFLLVIFGRNPQVFVGQKDWDHKPLLDLLAKQVGHAFGRSDAVSVFWHLISLILVICRLLNPSSELHIAEHFYKNTALTDLLGVSAEPVQSNHCPRSRAY